MGAGRDGHPAIQDAIIEPPDRSQKGAPDGLSVTRENRFPDELGGLASRPPKARKIGWRSPPQLQQDSPTTCKCGRAAS
eukprot:5720314-Pyramimonas_sp.AAC.1